MSEINVTPFVDVMLVLLIVFMVTAPMLTVGIPVNLPNSDADSLPDDKEPLTLSINSKGEIFIQDSKVGYSELIAKILAFLKIELILEFMYVVIRNINYGRDDGRNGKTIRIWIF